MQYPDAVNELPNNIKQMWISAFNAAFEKYSERTDGVELAGGKAWDRVGKEYGARGLNRAEHN